MVYLCELTALGSSPLTDILLQTPPLRALAQIQTGTEGHLSGDAGSWAQDLPNTSEKRPQAPTFLDELGEMGWPGPRLWAWRGRGLPGPPVPSPHAPESSREGTHRRATYSPSWLECAETISIGKMVPKEPRGLIAGNVPVCPSAVHTAATHGPQTVSSLGGKCTQVITQPQEPGRRRRGWSRAVSGSFNGGSEGSILGRVRRHFRSTEINTSNHAEQTEAPALQTNTSALKLAGRDGCPE